MTSIATWVTIPKYCQRVPEGRGDFDERLALAYVTWRYGTPTPERVADELAQLIDASKGGTRGHFRIVRDVAQWVEEFSTAVSDSQESTPANHLALAYLSFNEMNTSQHMILSVLDAFKAVGFCPVGQLYGPTTRLLKPDVPRRPQFAAEYRG